MQTAEAISVDEVIRAAETMDRGTWLRGWGMQASEPDLEVVQLRLLMKHEPKTIANLLRVFSNRSAPHVDARLIELCHDTDQNVRRWAMNAPEKVSHPLVRNFAFAELQKQRSDKPVVGLFIRNYQDGDDQRLLDQLKLPDDLCLRHWMLMDLTKVLEQNESAESLWLGQIDYFIHLAKLVASTQQNYCITGKLLRSGCHKNVSWIPVRIVKAFLAHCLVRNN